jgi:ABC-2 type transport system ATP-binding protein
VTGKAIGVADLHVRYRGKNGKWAEAVRGLTFSVKAGEVVGFLGPNGAGKSSTLKALMGFVEPQSGSCDVFGLKAGSLEAKSRIGYLPEVAMYYPFLTPVETLRLYGELQGLRGSALNRECNDLLELVGLSEAKTKLNKNLSKGMLQRVGIAQSLLGSPELLILDEVTSGLDPVGRRELRGLLKERQKQGATLFFSSHELSEVDMLCNRILLINKGILVEEREMESLKEELRRYSLTYWGAPPLIGLASSMQELKEGAVQASFPTKTDLLTAMEKIQHAGGHITDVVAQEGSLEQYFVDRIGEAA